MPRREIEYRPERDILIVRIGGRAVEEKFLDNDVVLGLDGEGNVAYVEVWGASRRGLLEAARELLESIELRPTSARR